MISAKNVLKTWNLARMLKSQIYIYLIHLFLPLADAFVYLCSFSRQTADFSKRILPNFNITPYEFCLRFLIPI